jgi:hypothetical protein
LTVVSFGATVRCNEALPDRGVHDEWPATEDP